jgi:hypothetical protein
VPRPSNNGRDGPGRRPIPAANAARGDPAASRPTQCGQLVNGIAGSDKVMVVASGQGDLSRSADGDAWNHVVLADGFTSPPTWTGTSGTKSSRSFAPPTACIATLLPMTAFTGSHPISYISFGYVPTARAGGRPERSRHRVRDGTPP